MELLTVYIGDEGKEVSEEDSFIAAVETLDNALDNSTNAFKSVGKWLGNVPEMLGKLFTFLPPEISIIIGLGIVMIIVLRIAGR